MLGTSEVGYQPAHDRQVLRSTLTLAKAGRSLKTKFHEERMRRMRVIFAGALVLLLLIFSFNAYACLLPLFGVPQSAMGGSCADPQDQPVRQFCDTFTTLGLHAASDFHLSVDAQVVSPVEAEPLTWLMSLSTWTSLIQGYPAQRPPQDALVRTTVLRI